MGEEHWHDQQNCGKYPQESYFAVARAIQSEWIFLQRVTWDTGDAFAGVEKMLRETFLPHIFFRNKKYLSPIVGYLSKLTFNKYELGIPNPVTSAKEKYLSSQWGITEPIYAVAGGGVLSNAGHLLALGEEMHDRQKNRAEVNDATLKGLFRDLIVNDRSIILRDKNIGDWICVRGTTVSGTLLSAKEFRDFLCARYNAPLLNIKIH